MSIDLTDKYAGVLIGTAVGDSLGLPFEGYSKKRLQKIAKNKWKQRFLFGYGMTSDDTEHSLIVARALVLAQSDPDKFCKILANSFRMWILSLPSGIGKATLLSIIKLWFGKSPRKSGVFSAGNGAAMRSAIIGAYYHDDPEKISEYVKLSTEISHSDPKAFIGADVIAHLTAWSMNNDKIDIDKLKQIICKDYQCSDWHKLSHLIISSIDSRISVEEFCAEIECEKGVSGYVYHTVPVAVFAFIKHFGDFEKTLTSVLNCGGDTDTVGAITGALAGAVAGEKNIPKTWKNKICDYPGNKYILVKMAGILAQKENADKRPPYIFWPILAPKNILGALVQILHVFRMFLPPY